MALGRKDTPLAETPTPDYRNIKTTKRRFFKDEPYTPTAKDSTEYREGFQRGLEGKNKWFPSESSVRGNREATQRGLNPKKKR